MTWTASIAGFIVLTRMGKSLIGAGAGAGTSEDVLGFDSGWILVLTQTAVTLAGVVCALTMNPDVRRRAFRIAMFGFALFAPAAFIILLLEGSVDDRFLGTLFLSIFGLPVTGVLWFILAPISSAR